MKRKRVDSTALGYEMFLDEVKCDGEITDEFYNSGEKNMLKIYEKEI